MDHIGQQVPSGPVAVVGAGAIGLAVASAFLRAGRPVIVCGGHTPIDHIAITEDGAVDSWPVIHTDVQSDIAGVDTVVLAVKAQQTESASGWLRAASSPDTTVVVAQNGIEQRDRVAPFVGEARIVPAVVYLNVERTAQGTAVLRRAGARDLVLPDDAPSGALAEQLRAGRMRVDLDEDFLTTSWRKLLTNITANPLTALTGRRVEVMRDPGIAAIARSIMTEAVAVAQAEGAGLTDDDVQGVLDWLDGIPAGSTTSMREDRVAGRPLEYDALTGAVVRAGERHGIDVPVNRLILALLAAIGPLGDGGVSDPSTEDARTTGLR